MLDDACPWSAIVLIVVGGLYLAKTVLGVLGSLYSTFLRPGKNLKKYGAWAVVTGATGELNFYALVVVVVVCLGVLGLCPESASCCPA